MNNDILQYLIQKGYEWISNQRDIHFISAHEISKQDKESLDKYFEPGILELPKIKFVDYIENPPFYSEIKSKEVPDFINFSQMDGITFIDCILISRRFSHTREKWISLLFHEMVHVAQYYLLGPKRFTELYVRGWAQNGFDYSRIPLEIQAQNLQKQFDQGVAPFSVLQILRQHFKLNG